MKEITNEVTTGIFATNVKTATTSIKKNIQTKSDKAAGAFKTAVDGFTSLVEAANKKIMFVKNERQKRLNEIKILDETVVTLERQKMKNHIIESRLLSLLEVSETEIDKQLGIVKPDTLEGISAKPDKKVEAVTSKKKNQ